MGSETVLMLVDTIDNLAATVLFLVFLAAGIATATIFALTLGYLVRLAFLYAIRYTIRLMYRRMAEGRL